MNPSIHSSSGVVRCLRVFGDTLLADAKDRVALFAVEFEEEKLRLIQTLIWISAAVFTGVMALTLATLTLVYIFWDGARITVLLGMTGCYAVSFVLTVVWLRRMMARQPGPFAATIAEIEEDRQCIRPRD